MEITENISKAIAYLKQNAALPANEKELAEMASLEGSWLQDITEQVVAFDSLLTDDEIIKCYTSILGYAYLKFLKK